MNLNKDKMIKSNELRIGNLVKPINARHGETILETESIADEYINMSFRMYSLKNIEGLQLTEEWLVRFGFEKSFDSPFVEYEWKLDKFSLSENLEPHLGMFTGENEFKYVHQLQNLYFALTGKELTIK